MLEQIKEFVHTLKELVDIYHKHDNSINQKLDSLIVELQQLNARLEVLVKVARYEHPRITE